VSGTEALYQEEEGGIGTVGTHQSVGANEERKKVVSLQRYVEP